jgi:hypothetical protein
VRRLAVVLPLLAAGTLSPAADPGARALPGPGLEAFEAARPVLERRCVACHGEILARSGLSLARREAALAGGRRGPALVPGKPGESLLLRMVEGTEGGAPAMPKGDPPLAAGEVAALRAWIAAGAVWPEGLVLEESWWSRDPLAAPPVPDAAAAAVGPPVPPGWPRTPIDAFILERLRGLGLAPSPEADRRTLIRRLAFDLHGLPPAPEEIEAFAADRAPDAYERLVDRLLASPRYGERWGRHWLDVVHFGETHGFDKDKLRPNAWPYRDWVIRAFNEDTPYARFVADQLAGDVLRPEDPDAVVATGFIAAGPWDFVGHVELREGTVDKMITRSLDRDDMVMTAMSTFASTTVHCARCHEHKFDPIPQADYYRLQAVFAGVERADRAYGPDAGTQRRRLELRREEEALLARSAEIDALLAARATPALREVDARLAALGAELAAPAASAGGETSSTNGYHSAIAPERDATKWVEVDLGAAVPIERVVLVPARPVDFPDTPGFGFPVRYRVEAADEPRFEAPRVLLDRSAEDAPGPGDRAVVIEAGGTTGRYVRVTATRLWERTGDWVLALAELEVHAGGRNAAAGVAVTALDSIEAGRWSARHLVDGYSSRARLGGASGLAGAAGADSAAGAAARREAAAAEVRALEARREALAAELLGPHLEGERARGAARRDEVRAALAALPPERFVYAAASRFAPEGSFVPPVGPREIRLLGRGSVKDPGEIVLPGALSFARGLARHFELERPGDEGPRRVALARWLLDPENPLTWRSIVNRLWQYHFGRGLVDSPNDFGRMGSLPTHPELLDWLAVWFRDGGGSFKTFHRLLLTSAVYRQSSASREDGVLADSSNLYLWRMSRGRLEAEALRDAVLHVTGKLDLEMGGPSARQFLFKDDHSPVYDYARFDASSPESYRRSIYRFIVRSVPDPFMECLDCADPSLLTPKRYPTLTALQALALLNNPFMTLQAEHFAARLEREAEGPAAQVERAFELALGRRPAAEEAAVLAEYAARHGLSSFARLVFNTNEFIFLD